MHTQPHQYQVLLAHRGLFHIADAAGVTVRCDQGSVWLTLDNDPRDIVLEVGEIFTTGDHLHALVYALGDSAITLQAASPPQLSVKHAAAPARARFGLYPAAA